MWPIPIDCILTADEANGFTVKLDDGREGVAVITLCEQTAVFIGQGPYPTRSGSQNAEPQP